jgi:hypothetical protein
MNEHPTLLTRFSRGPSFLLALLLAAASVAVLPWGLLAAEPSSSPESAGSVQPSMAAAEAVCASADDLRLIVGFLRDTDTSTDGWVPVVVGAIAGLAEARDLLGLAEDAYRPLVEDLVVSLQDLASITDELRGLETAGAQVAAVGTAITAVGEAMDALSVAMRVPCPADPS